MRPSIGTAALALTAVSLEEAFEPALVAVECGILSPAAEEEECVSACIWARACCMMPSQAL